MPLVIAFRTQLGGAEQNWGEVLEAGWVLGVRFHCVPLSLSTTWLQLQV